MTRIAVDVINPVDLEFVMKILEALEQRRIIAIKKEVPISTKNPEPDSLAFEGPPLTVEELNQIIEESEKGGKHSYEEFKSKFNL